MGPGQSAQRLTPGGGHHGRRAGPAWSPLFVLPALALPAACGDDADPLDLVSTAGAETVDGGAAPLHATDAAALGGATVTVESDGLVDFDGDRASPTTRLPRGRGEFEVVADGTTVYYRGSGVAAQLTSWARPPR